MGTLVFRSTIDILDRSEGALLGAALGDAAGWPQEPAARRIGRRPAASGPLLTAWQRRAGGRFRSYLEPIAAGEYSDDTQLILASARSLMHQDWWRHLTQVELPTWTLYERGGGGATKRAAAMWLRGTPLWAAPSRDAERYFAAGGNGVAMRILPHVIAGTGTPFQTTAAAVFENGIASHGHPRALVGALLHANVLFRAFRQKATLSYGGLVHELIASKTEWSAVPESARIHEWTRSIDGTMSDAFRHHWLSTIDEVERLLDITARAIDEGTLAVDAEVLRSLGAMNRETGGAGTVTAVAALFLASRFAADPMLALRQAAFAPSVDTDTIASMTGSILGALYGCEWLRAAVGQLQDVAYLGGFGILCSSNRSNMPIDHVERVTTTNIRRAERMLAAAKEGDYWELPDGRTGIVTRVLELESKVTRTIPVMWTVRLTDGQTIHLTKASRQRNSEHSTPTNFYPVDVHRVIVRLPVADLQAAAGFYTNVLGLPITAQTSISVEVGRLLILVKRSTDGRPQQEGNGWRSIVRVDTGTIDAVWRNARTFGARIKDPLSPGTSRRFFRCEDLDHNVIEVVEDAHGRDRVAIEQQRLSLP